MKKKLALVLASVMTVSALPMNLFAAANMSLQGMSSYYPVYSVLYEKGILGSTTVRPVTDPDALDVVNYVVDGGDLVIELNDTVTAGENFRIKLEGAEFFFKGSAATVTDKAARFNNYASNPAGVPQATTPGAAMVDVVLDGQTNDGVPILTTDGTTPITQPAGTIAGSTRIDTSLANDATKLAAAAKVVKDSIAATQTTNTVSKLSRELGGIKRFVNPGDSSKKGVYYTLPITVAGLTGSDQASDYVAMNVNSNYKFTYTKTGGITVANTYDPDKGIFNAASGTANHLGDYYRFPLNAALDGSGVGSYGVARELPYVLNLNQSWGPTDAQVTILPLQNEDGAVIQRQYPKSYMNGVQNYTIRIPMAVRTTSATDVKVRVYGSTNGAIQENIYALGTSTDNRTTTSISTSSNYRDEITLTQITIKEDRISSFKNGGILELKAPTGFTFSDPNALTSTGARVVNVGVDNGLSWRAGKRGDGIGAVNASVLGVPDYYMTYRSNYNTNIYTGTTVSDGYDMSTIYLYVPANNLIPSSAALGAMNIRGLKLLADQNAPFGAATISVRTFPESALNNYYDNTFTTVTNSLNYRFGTVAPTVNATDLGVSTQTGIAAGTRADWVLGLTQVGDVPTLTTGAYNSATEFRAEDLNHKAVRVKLAEGAVSSWWAGRETKLTLPEGVKFRRINISDSSEMTNINGDYLANGLRNPYVQVNSDSILLYNLNINAGKKASLLIDSWISIASGFTGDVNLTLANSSTVTTGVSNTGDLKVVIAKTENPVTLKVDVKEIKVGYQTFATGDITITETKPGKLQANKQLLVSVSDMITQDLYFAPINAAKDVKTENIAVSNVTTVNTDSNTAATFGVSGTNSSLFLGGGTISMNIATPSVAKAGVITLSNLNVKVNRSVPQSTVNYKAIVWGNAIAANYGPNKDEFTTPGISTEYIKVVSSATDKASVLTQEVRLTIGEKYVLVGGKSVDMNEGGVSGAAYLSTKSNSTMVPVRFVAYAFGITPDQVIWDATTLTATIIHPTRIVQFTANSNKMMLNGAPVTMDNGAIAELTGDRMYIPFRALGNAFGITVDWDEPTQTAIYNKTAVVAAPATK